jgi:antirestriction protein ArdC
VDHGNKVLFLRAPEAVQITMQNTGIKFAAVGDRPFYSPAGELHPIADGYRFRTSQILAP